MVTFNEQGILGFLEFFKLIGEHLEKKGAHPALTRQALTIKNTSGPALEVLGKGKPSILDLTTLYSVFSENTKDDAVDEDEPSLKEVLSYYWKDLPLTIKGGLSSQLPELLFSKDTTTAEGKKLAELMFGKFVPWWEKEMVKHGGALNKETRTSEEKSWKI